MMMINIFNYVFKGSQFSVEWIITVKRHFNDDEMATPLPYTLMTSQGRMRTSQRPPLIMPVKDGGSDWSMLQSSPM